MSSCENNNRTAFYQLVNSPCVYKIEYPEFSSNNTTKINMFPYDILPLDEETNKQLLEDFKGERTGFVQVGPKKWILPAAYEQHAEKFYTFPVRNDDIWILTYPRSGTTLCQELVWLINNNLDYEAAAKTPMESRFPFLEFNILHHEKLHQEIASLNEQDPRVVRQLSFWREPVYGWAGDLPSPRYLKSHLPFSLLPPGLLAAPSTRVIYVARSPKDVAVSYFHHNRLLKLHDFQGNFNKYWQYFQNDLLVYSPYWEHLLEAWERRHKENVLFLFYEELNKDLTNSIQKVATFLGKSLTEEEIQKLSDHLQIDNFRKVLKVHEDVPMEGIVNTSEQGFIRKGKVGEHDEFTKELDQQADEWIAKHSETTDLRFPMM